MGLAGRDPFFFAQLASETQTFHEESEDLVQTVCLGCHGIAGERQFNIDTVAEGGACAPFTRSIVDTMPWVKSDDGRDLAKYAMLARDGINCTACHRMALGDRATDAQAGAPENACVSERQDLLNPDSHGFARTFSGSFMVGPPDSLIGPFEAPQAKPMQHAMGISPQYHETISSSEVCGSCHTVHLPVLHEGKTLGYIYEHRTAGRRDIRRTPGQGQDDGCACKQTAVISWPHQRRARSVKDRSGPAHAGARGLFRWTDCSIDRYSCGAAGAFKRGFRSLRPSPKIFRWAAGTNAA